MKKVPFIPQFNATECGVCVLTMILHYFGAYYPLQEVRSHLPVGRDGATIRMLIEAFAYYGIEASAFHGVVDKNSEFTLPAIVNWEDSHYVILEYMRHEYLYIVDSDIGRMKISYEEFNKGYSGIIILLTKTAQFQKVKKRFHLKNSFSTLLTHYKKSIFLLIHLSFFAQLFALAIPVIIQHLIDGMFSMHLNFYHVAYLVVAIFFNAICIYAKGHYMAILGVQLDRDVNTGIVAKLMKVPYNFYDRKSNAEIFYALDNISCIKSIYLDNILGCLFDILSILFIFGYLFYTNSVCSVLVLIVLIPNILFLLYTDEPIQRDSRLMTKEYGNISGQQIEMVYSILGIKSTSVEHTIFDKWLEKYNFYYKKNRDYQIKRNTFNVVLSTMITLSPVIVLVFSIFFAREGLMTIGVALAFYTMTNMLFGSVYTVINAIRDFRNNSISLERIEDIMQCEEGTLSSHTIIETDIDGDIEVKSICFKYSKESEYALKNISFSIPQNSKVAIIGGSGSGKSTLLKVLSGLYKIDEGTILYNGKRMEGDIEASIKKQIGFVAQNAWLMNKSIKDNIMLGLTNVTMEDVEHACRIVNIHDEIINMPMRYQTIITEAGKNISGGQCQRIILARMVLLKPKILLLDEATSALDVINEAKILDYFYRTNCTVITITHKLEFLKNCDLVLFMKNGFLSIQGKYDELIQGDGELPFDKF